MHGSSTQGVRHDGAGAASRLHPIDLPRIYAHSWTVPFWHLPQPSRWHTRPFVAHAPAFSSGAPACAPRPSRWPESPDRPPYARAPRASRRSARACTSHQPAQRFLGGWALLQQHSLNITSKPIEAGCTINENFVPPPPLV